MSKSVCGFLLVLLLAVPSVAQVSQAEEPSPEPSLSLTVKSYDLVESLLNVSSDRSPLKPPAALATPPDGRLTPSSFTEGDGSSTESGGKIEPWG